MAARRLSYLFSQNNRLGDVSHRLALLPALLLQTKISLLFAQSEIALQNSLCPFYDFSRLQLIGEVRIHFLHPRQFNFRAHLKSDRRNHPDLCEPVSMRTTMLHIDRSHHSPPAHQRNGEKRFVTIFRQLVKELEPRIERGLFREI